MESFINKVAQVAQVAQPSLLKKRTFHNKIKKIVCPLGETSFLTDRVAQTGPKLGHLKNLLITSNG